ncbi:MAG: Verru_Chthon cassette protein B [Verrucomicrobiales bacterium]|nr:Verru_Chthon cassette protein B [Verrucomicrobiales bacterium]
MKIPFSNSARFQRGFSLVEVTLAMAIAAVALVSIIGMVPQGLQTMQEAGDQAIEARIHQQILNELQMAPYGDPTTSSTMDEYHEFEIYYDDQGEEIGDSSSDDDVKGSFGHVYSARISVPKQGDATPTSVGGADFEGFQFSSVADPDQVNNFLRPVIIEVAAVSGRGSDFDWELESNKRFISSYRSYVVKMGKDYTK